MLMTILASRIKEERGSVDIRIVLRTQNERDLTDLHRFMTHIEICSQTINSRHVAGHYDMTADEAYQDFLNRCKVEGIALEGEI